MGNWGGVTAGEVWGTVGVVVISAGCECMSGTCGSRVVFFFIVSSNGCLTLFYTLFR